MRFFERALRRAGLPARMSQGFNPRPRFSIAAALGVGVAARDEILDVDFDEPIAPELVRRKLAGVMIPGIEITSAEGSDHKLARVVAGSYHVQLPPEVAIAPDAVAGLLSQTQLMVDRSINKKTKRIDIRPYILDIHVLGSTVTMRLAITESGAARPEEVIAALAGTQQVDRNRLQITRTALEVEPGQA